MPVTPDIETVIAFDFGLRRIGVAVGQAVTRSATPLKTLPATDGVPEAGALAALILEWHPTRLLLGTPLAADQDSPLRTPLERFRGLLEEFGIPVELVDEQFSSAEAEARLAGLRRSGDRRRRVAKGDIDSLSAGIIAEQWLSRH